jgi:hypothetical protein
VNKIVFSRESHILYVQRVCDIEYGVSMDSYLGFLVASFKVHTVFSEKLPVISSLHMLEPSVLHLALNWSYVELYIVIVLIGLPQSMVSGFVNTKVRT